VVQENETCVWAGGLGGGVWGGGGGGRTQDMLVGVVGQGERTKCWVVQEDEACVGEGRRDGTRGGGGDKTCWWVWWGKQRGPSAGWCRKMKPVGGQADRQAGTL
jgi:hypothetical protein